MAFDTSELRHASWLPFNSPVADPSLFEAYFTVIPNCLQSHKVELFGSNGSKVGNLIDKGLNAVKNTIQDKLSGPSVATNVRFRVQAADLPTSSFENMARFTHGPVRQVPFGMIYPTIVIEVIESDQFDIRKFFEKWQSIATGKNNNAVSDKSSSRYEPRYYNDIVGEFTLVAFGKNGLPQARWTFKEAYPMTVTSSQMNWGTRDSYLAIPVELAYHEYEFKELNLTDILTDPAYGAAVAAGLVKGVSGGINNRAAGALTGLSIGLSGKVF